MLKHIIELNADSKVVSASVLETAWRAFLFVSRKLLGHTHQQLQMA